MSICKIKEYSFFDKYDKDISVLCISDLHINETNIKKIYKTIDEVNRINPKYLFILGDIINNRDIFKAKKISKTIIDIFNKIDKNIQVYYVYGNHEYYGNKYNDEFDKTFNEMNKLSNIHFLSNDVIENDDIYICGISLSEEYYGLEIEGIENPSILNDELIKIKKKMKDDKKKPKVLLLHSPICLIKDENHELIKDFDTVITGHMHNGGVPYILDDISKSSWGFISPYGKLGGKVARNIYENIIINGPISVVKDAKHIINLFFPIHMSIINYKIGEKDLKRKEYYKKI